MAELLRELQGRFLLSINDVPAVRDIFAGFAMRELAVAYTAPTGSNAHRARELLICG